MQVIYFISESACFYVILAYAFSLIYRVLNFFHLAHAISLTFGSYFTYHFSIQLNLPLLLSIPFSILFCIALLLLVNQFIYKALFKQKTESWQMLIASLGIYVVLQNVVSLIWGDSSLSFRIWSIRESHQVLGAYVTDIQIIAVVVNIGLLVLSYLFLEKSHIGKKMKAVSSNPELAGTLGISKIKAILWSFVLGSGLAASAGILIAADTDMTPTMGFNWLLYGVLAMIIGGMGKMRYLFLGALLLATAQHLAAYYFDSKWINATAYIILIIFLHFKPYGFSSKQLKKAEI